MLRSVLLWSFCLPSIQVLNVFPLSFSYTDYMFLTLAYRTISAVPCPATVFSIFPLFCFDSSISPFLILLVLLLELLFHIFFPIAFFPFHPLVPPGRLHLGSTVYMLLFV